MGAQKLDEVLLWCNELGIPAVTLWVCSDRKPKTTAGRGLRDFGSGGGQDCSASGRPLDSPATRAGQGRRPPQSPATVYGGRNSQGRRGNRRLRRDDTDHRGGLWGREEIADAVRDLIRAKVRDGLGVDELAEHITPASSTNISIRSAFPIPSSSAPAARCGYRAFCYGKALIANSTLRTSIGRSSAKSTSCARFSRFEAENATLWAVTRAARKALEPCSKECQQ